MKRAFGITACVLGCVGVFCLWQYLREMREYEVGQQEYTKAVEEYVVVTSEAPVSGPVSENHELDDLPVVEEPVEVTPIQVDFDSLLADCQDIRGWIYCEGTSINYPVVQGKTNTQYLRHAYTGRYAVSGSIFLDSANGGLFEDCNNIIYGHCMKDGTMFACLSQWSVQEFYNEHPIIWLLTPEQDYKIEVFSGYVTPALSGAHTVYIESNDSFKDYIEKAYQSSDFECSIELDPDAKYILLSTCNYKYDDARYVLHGKLVPFGEKKGN